MPTKISQLPAATLPLTGAEQIELTQNANSRRATLSDAVGPASVFAPAAGSGLTATTVSAALSELDARDFQVSRFMTVSRNAGGTSLIAEHGTQSLLVGTADQPALVGNGTVFQATHRRGAISAAAINSGASFYDIAASAFAAASGLARSVGFTAAWRGGLGVARADQKFILGMIASTAQILNSTEVPSNTLNCLVFGKDQGDANLQIMHNDGAGVATRIDTGVVFTSLAGILFEARIVVPLSGGSARFLLINKESGAVLVNQTIVAGANFPAPDSLLYWHGDVNTGTATATAVSIYLNKLHLLSPL